MENEIKQLQQDVKELKNEVKEMLELLHYSKVVVKISDRKGDAPKDEFAKRIMNWAEKNVKDEDGYISLPKLYNNFSKTFKYKPEVVRKVVTDYCNDSNSEYIMTKRIPGKFTNFRNNATMIIDKDQFYREDENVLF